MPSAGKRGESEELRGYFGSLGPYAEFSDPFATYRTSTLQHLAEMLRLYQQCW